VRHHHKYADAELPQHLRFFFAPSAGRRGPVAANLTQFQHAVDDIDDRVLRTHAEQRDFSRWIRDVLSDAVLAAAVAEIESACPTTDLAEIRRQLLAVISSRYPQANRSESTAPDPKGLAEA
jgi:hypothetical protein